MRRNKDEKVEELLNSLLQVTFQMNSHADNCAYWLAFNDFIKTQNIFHEKYAHKFPEWADLISDFMIKLGFQPIRKSLEENDYDYSDFIELFEDVENELEHYKELIYKTIDTITLHNFREIVSFLDNYLLELTDYTQQVSIWLKKAEDYSNMPFEFDEKFKEITFI